MNYIYRETQGKIVNFFSTNQPEPLAKGLILSGIVGCGKTTVIEKALDQLAQQYEIFKFSGDDSVFRQMVKENSNYILEYVQSRTTGAALVFVDEVQKSENIFDALKIAFDKAKISFIVSGSNPAYLSTVARKRLQRRAEQLFMLPLSLSELGIDKGWFSAEDKNIFEKIIFEPSSLDEIVLPSISLHPSLSELLRTFFVFGGLPLTFYYENPEEKLREIRLVIERGFELMSEGNGDVADQVRIELAHLHSIEFTYKNILEKTRLRKRDVINLIIDQLINNGYLVKKKPSHLEGGKASYLNVFSYIDPGIVSYLTSSLALGSDLGVRVEGYVHARLSAYIYNTVFKSELSYFKPHALDSAGHVRYLPGEIDFILKSGKKLIPIEVKSTVQPEMADFSLLIDFIKTKKCPFGLVIYGGVPKKDLKNKILFWPYWLL